VRESMNSCIGTGMNNNRYKCSKDGDNRDIMNIWICDEVFGLMDEMESQWKVRLDG